jgi:hypothetical protein
MCFSLFVEGRNFAARRRPGGSRDLADRPGHPEQFAQSAVPLRAAKYSPGTGLHGFGN